MVAVAVAVGDGLATGLVGVGDGLATGVGVGVGVGVVGTTGTMNVGFGLIRTSVRIMKWSVIRLTSLLSSRT